MVGGYEMLKQLPHQSDFYGDDPALIVMVVDPFSTRRIIDQTFNITIKYYNHRDTTYIHWTQETTLESFKNLALIPIKLSRPDLEGRHVATVACLWMGLSYPKLTQELARHLVP